VQPPIQAIVSTRFSGYALVRLFFDKGFASRVFLIGGAGVSVFGFSLAPVYAQNAGLKIARTTETRSTCPYCSVSCGVIIHTLGDKSRKRDTAVVHVEGDPDSLPDQSRHALSQGCFARTGYRGNEAAAAKTAVATSGRSRPLDDISWMMLFNEIARWVKKTRDATFIEKDAQGRTANRVENDRLDRRLHRYERI